MRRRYLFEHRGRVQAGRRLGRRLGAPTANLPLATDAGVPFGTFAAIVEGLDRPYHAVAHVGVRPSIGSDGEPLLEAYLLDFAGDLYGRHVVVKLAHKVAEEVSVGSRAALRRKIAADVALVRAYFARRGGFTPRRSYRRARRRASGTACRSRSRVRPRRAGS